VSPRAPRPRYARSAVAGKFYPFHRGHRLLIETALAGSDQVTVIVGSHAAELIPGALRASWVREAFPAADVILVDCDSEGLQDDDSEAWARFTIQRLGGAPDAVFSGEPYGEVWAAWMSRFAGRPVAHVRVDRTGLEPPISGTAVRSDLRASIDHLDEHVARYFAPRRVVVLGAESTGKSTLSRDLAEALSTVPVPEYGALYTQALADPQSYTWREEDFVAIAEGQLALEDAAVELALAPVVICDTDAYVTALFCESYLGKRSAAVERLAAERRYDLYLVCDPQTPFEQDATGTRRLAQRDFLHRRELAYARGIGTTVELFGTREARFEQAVGAIGVMLGETAAPTWAWPGWHLPA
jgi:HTH-type transcriptional regulator, transcriptional repressor of NAD biosynthesis genes